MKWKVIALVLAGVISLFTAYILPRAMVFVALLSHDALALELMQDGWLEESRSETVSIERLLHEPHDQTCAPDAFVEWEGLAIGYGSATFTPTQIDAAMLRLVSADDRIQVTIMEGSIGLALNPVADFPRLAKQYNALFDSATRFDVLVAILESGERSPVFTTPSAHFKREWLARLKAMVLRAGSEEGVWIVESEGMQAIVPQGSPRVFGIDLYATRADRFLDVTIRGAADANEAVQVLGCISVDAK